VKDERVYLYHALECIRRIDKHRRSGRRRFFESDTIQDAVLRNLQTMAESTQRLSDEIKATPPHIRWEQIAGFRNVLVHDYLGIDLETIWGIMQNEVRELRTAIEEMLDLSVDDEE
jgi:uncharacterized protein with HEPN domain